MNINATLLGQLIMFALFVWFCMKFIWPPVVNAMAERKKTIEEGLLAADEGNKKLQQAKTKAEEILNQTKNQAKGIIDNAESQAGAIVDEAKSVAIKEADKIKLQAKNDLDKEVVKTRNDLKQEVSALVIKGVESILEKEVDINTHKNMLDKLSQSL